MKRPFIPRAALLCIGLLMLLGACAAQPPVAQGISDPNEARNRAIHAANKRGDERFLRPVAHGYGKALPEPVRRSVGNFAGNLDLPKFVVNDILQGSLDDAAHNSMRFLINTTFGIGGIFDPAGQWGLPERSSDFGETLHVWGVEEGNYQELRFLGPSTERDTAGRVVDFFLNPLSYALPTPERYAMPVSAVASRLGDRYRFTETIDSVLYESADSYAQTRLLYLQNRRFQLGQDAPVEEEVDPFALDTAGF